MNQEKMFRLASLNANGIRSAVSKGLPAWMESHKLDCICLQELKAQEADLVAGKLETINGMKGYFHCAEKKGYAGVGIYTRFEPTDVRMGFGEDEFDREGRYIEARFDDGQQKKSIISCYFPSGSSSPERQAAKNRFLEVFFPYLQALSQERSLILCGDINIAHQEIDLKNWKGNLKNSGFLPHERDWMSRMLSDMKLRDVYRLLHPQATHECYTWWSQRGQARANNVGWRIDYQIASPDVAQKARRALIYKDKRFSDHAPVMVEYENLF